MVPFIVWSSANNHGGIVGVYISVQLGSSWTTRLDALLFCLQSLVFWNSILFCMEWFITLFLLQLRSLAIYQTFEPRYKQQSMVIHNKVQPKRTVQCDPWALYTCCTIDRDVSKEGIREIQAGAELCQAHDKIELPKKGRSLNLINDTLTAGWLAGWLVGWLTVSI